jgi:hypothetical protein
MLRVGQGRVRPKIGDESMKKTPYSSRNLLRGRTPNAVFVDFRLRLSCISWSLTAVLHLAVHWYIIYPQYRTYGVRIQLSHPTSPGFIGSQLRG